jgi:hypothetical protein
MIHLVTSTSALHDVIAWLTQEDVLVIAGDALNSVHDLNEVPCRAITFSEDKVLFPHIKIEAITTDEWIDLLVASPCRTWS